MRGLSGSRKIYAFVSLLLGVMLLLWPVSTLRMAACVAGVIITAGGVAAVLSYFRDSPGAGIGSASLIAGIFVILVGGWIFLNPENFAAAIPTAVGCLIVISGILKLFAAFSLSRAQYGGWWISLLTAVATIGMGLLLVNHAFGIAATIVRVGGALILVNAVSDLWISRRVDQYVLHGKGSSGASGRNASGRGSRSASNKAGGTLKGAPDIIDAEEGDYREL